MKAVRLLAAVTAACVMLAAPAAWAQHTAGAAPHSVGGLPWAPPPPPAQGHAGSHDGHGDGHGGHDGHGGRGLHGRVIFVEPVYNYPPERQAGSDDLPPAPPPAAALQRQPPREPFVIGRTYRTLPPNGCLKLLTRGTIYYGCSGDWYRALGVARYVAVAQP